MANGREPLIEQPASRLTALAVDCALTVVCYFAAYRLRFDSSELARFLPAASRTLPLVAASQIIGLFVFRAYKYTQGSRWLPRLLAGVFAGTAVGALAVWPGHWVSGVSRLSYVLLCL